MSKTLQELENDDWGEPEYDSHLVTTCHRLRRKPLFQFTTEDLRIMIGQNIGLDYLLPMAMDVLDQDPLAGGAFFDGDLLAAVLRCDAVQAKGSPYSEQLVELCKRAIKEIEINAAEKASDMMMGLSAADWGMTSESYGKLLQEESEKIVKQDPVTDKIREFLKSVDR